MALRIYKQGKGARTMKKTLDWNKYMKAALDLSAEGIVLLENNGVLPLAKGTRIALFGRMQNHYYKSGSGSGGMVNVNHVVTIREAFDTYTDLILDENLKKIYEKFDEDQPIDKGVGWGNEPWSQKEMPLNEALVADMADQCDVAVMILARLAGEDRDNVMEKGSFLLSDEEEEMISKVCAAFKKTIVLINSGGLIDMSFVSKYAPSAVLYVWQAGMIGAKAIPMVLTGETAPSGHLTDTVAHEVTDYPSDKNFGTGDGERDNFEEDIYLGYRYFETFEPEKVLYPFGFGLTYTKFGFSETSCSWNDGKVVVSFKVTNTGSFKGKCVPMIFASCPQGKLGKPSKVLCGFSKTSLLNPGDTQSISIEIPENYFASYDDCGKTAYPYSWILEAGSYEFFIGENVRDCSSLGSIDLSEDKVIEKLETALKPIDAFKRIVPDKDMKVSYEDVPLREIEAIDNRFSRMMDEIPYKGDLGIRFEDVRFGKNTMEEFLSQLDDEQLALIVRGEGMGSPKVTTGTAGAFAGLTSELRAMGVPSCCCSDGPSGMRIDSGKCAFALPNGTCIASSFNLELVEELFEMFGLEMISNEIDVILGPGINIHRHPLNGRNFEYFSEDPFLTGKVAVSMLKALHKNKVTGCIKHFCTNNREKNRQTMSSNVSERALREIYLKGFEMAIKEAGAKCVMTVYNRINGVYGASNYELTTRILREDFGFKGIVMSDWWANINSAPYEEGHKSIHSEMVRAQNDLYMCCPLVERKEIDFTDAYAALKSGDLKRVEAQRCALNILNFAIETPAMDRLLGEGVEIEHVDSPFADDAIPVKTDLYYEIYDGASIDLTAFDTVGGHDAVFGLAVKEPGSYAFNVYAMSDLSDIAQVPMTCFYTSIPLKVITWNGTGGLETMQSVEVFCSGQPAIIRLHFAAPGIKLLRIEAKFICKERL